MQNSAAKLDSQRTQSQPRNSQRGRNQGCLVLATNNSKFSDTNKLPKGRVLSPKTYYALKNQNKLMKGDQAADPECLNSSRKRRPTMSTKMMQLALASSPRQFMKI